MMLRIDRLTVGFQRYDGWLQRRIAPVLTGVDLTVARHEMVAIVGESGAGKSVLAQAVLGLLPKTAIATGKLFFDERELTPDYRKSLRGRRIALVPQGVGWLDPTAPVGLQGRWGGRVCAADVVRSFARYDLPAHVCTLYPHQLSGGMARRVLIAIATLSGADLLIADEPSAGLDPECRTLTFGLLRGLADDGHGVAVITHDLTAIMPFADRIVILQSGKNIEDTDPARFLAGQLAHPYASALRAALPQYGFNAPADA